MHCVGRKVSVPSVLSGPKEKRGLGSQKEERALTLGEGDIWGDFRKLERRAKGLDDNINDGLSKRRGALAGAGRGGDGPIRFFLSGGRGGRGARGRRGKKHRWRGLPVKNYKIAARK